MPRPVALLICIVGIAGLFWFDPNRKVRTSWALWLPMAWLLIAGSRHVSAWLGMSPQASVEQYFDGSPLDRNIYALLLLGGFATLFSRRQRVSDILRRNWPILLFIAYCAFSVVWSDYPSVALKRWIKSLGDYVMVLVVLTDSNPKVALKKILGRVGFVLLPLSVIVIKYYPEIGRSYATHWEGTQFFVGVASDKNMLGMVCMVFGFAAYWRVVQAPFLPRRERLRTITIFGLLLAMAIWLLKISDSMTSFSCFCMASAVVFAATFVKAARKRSVVHFMVATTTLIAFSVLFLNVGAVVLQAMGRNPTLTGRTEIWSTLLEVPVNPVVGTGFESFWLGERLVQLWRVPIVAGINEAHNGYLEMYLNLGWIGVTLLLIMMVAAYRNVLRMLARDPELGRLLLGFFLIAVTYNFTEAATRSTALVWFAFLLATFRTPFARIPLKANSSDRRVHAPEPTMMEASWN